MASQKDLGSCGVVCLFLLCQELSKYHDWEWTQTLEPPLDPVMSDRRDSGHRLSKALKEGCSPGSIHQLNVKGVKTEEVFRVRVWSNPWEAFSGNLNCLKEIQGWWELKIPLCFLLSRTLSFVFIVSG